MSSPDVAQPRKLNFREKASPYFEIGLAYFQYLSLIYEIDLPWPHAWNTFLQWSSITTLANAFDLTGRGTSAALDSRAHFLVITVLFPLSLSFLMLLFAKPLHIIMWFFLLLFGVGLLAAGIALVLLGIQGNGGTLARAGSGCIAVCVLLLALWWWMRRTQWLRKARMLRAAMRERRAKRQAAAQAALAQTASGEDSPAGTRDSGSMKPLLIVAAPPDHPHMLPPPYVAAQAPLPASVPSPLPPPGLRLPPPVSLTPEQSMARLPSYAYDGSVTGRVLDQEKEEEKEAFQNAQQYVSKGTKRRGGMFFCTRLSLVAMLVFAGVTALGYIEYVPPQIVNSSFYTLRNVFGPILVGGGVALFFYVIIHCSYHGRLKVEAFKAFLEGRFIWIMLLSLTTLYIPFTATALGALRCVHLDCAEGYQPPVARRLVLDNVIAPPTFSRLTTGCDACNFVGNCSISSSLCAPTNVNRLAMDLSQPCSLNFPWMVPVAIITGLAITIGTPLLFYRLVVKHTRLLENIPAAGNAEDRWNFRCNNTRNSAKMLYHGFEYRWRFFRLLLIIQRLSVTVFTIFLFKTPLFLIYLTLGVHLAFFLINLTIRPYRHLGVDGLAFGTGGGLVATCALGVALYRGKIAEWGTGAVLGVDLGVPIVAMAVMLYVQKYRSKNRVAPMETELEAAKEKEKEKKEEERREAEKKEAEKPLHVVDHIINDFTLKTMSNFFMLAGVMAFLGLAIGIVGILYSNSQLNVVAPVVTTDSAAQAQFAGYTSWAEFTANCCCLSNTDHSVETWKCSNGYFKERMRETSGRHKKSGLSLRPYCSYSFSSEVCTIPSTDSNFKVGMCAGFKVDDYEATYLW